MFEATAAAKTSAVRVLVAPWVHGIETTELSYAGDVDLGPAAALDSFEDLHLEWYDHWVRGLDRGLDDRAPVRLFVMGGGTGTRTREGRLDHGGRWRDEREWPLARAEPQPYHLTAAYGLDPVGPPAESSTLTYAFDPDHPVPTIGGSLSSFSDQPPFHPAPDGGAVSYGEKPPVAGPGGYDQRERPDVFGAVPPFLPLAARRDVLVFESEPLREAVEVTGPIEVDLWVSTDAPDTDFKAKLIDRYPPSEDYPSGYALNLTDSILRLRYRDGGRASTYEPGSVVPVTITLYPTSNLFAVGHRIRLDISSSNFPRFDVNPNTGDPLWSERRSQVALNTIHLCPEHPSRVLLPIVRSSDLA